MIYMIADDPAGGALLDQQANRELDQIVHGALSVNRDQLYVAVQLDFRSQPDVWRRVIGEGAWLQPESDAADPETLYGFFEWAQRLCPADRYALILWGHSRGPFGVDYWKSWALSHEFQVIEHGMGEYWTQATSAIDIRAFPKSPGAEAPRWDPKAPWMEFVSPNNHALAGSDEERPGEWNRLELVCYQDDCVHIVNGKVVMALANARYRDGDKWVPMTGGTLQLQSEAAEVFYRDIEIRSIPAMPAEYRRYVSE